METLIKRKGLFPSMVKKSVNNFFYDFTATDLSNWTDKNFDTFRSKLSYLNLKEIDTNIEVELATKEDFKIEIDDDPLITFSERETAKTGDTFSRKGFNYRSFCRLPNC